VYVDIAVVSGYAIANYKLAITNTPIMTHTGPDTVAIIFAAINAAITPATIFIDIPYLLA
jgi:hypothetical protein